MQILAWNLGQRRALPALAPLIAANAPQLLMLQEADRPPNWPADAVGCAVPGRRWGSWLLAREGSLTPIPLPDYAGWLTGATWSNGSDSVECFSLHSPSGTDRSYVAECLRMVGLIDKKVGCSVPVVIGGDFNFKSFGKRAECEAVANTNEELRALDEFENLGFSIAWRATHRSAPLPQTLRWSRNPVTPYHSDGFLVRGLDIRGCEIVRTDDLGSPSDHDPVLVALAPTGAA